jgi:hypothetical protein
LKEKGFMPKKQSKLEQLSQTHGKADAEDTSEYKPTSLEQILGNTGTSKYGTLDEEAYSKRINAMNKADLQTHATQIGIVPIDNRDRLVKTLLSQFRLHVSAFRHPVGKTTQNRQLEITPDVAKILATGR